MTRVSTYLKSDISIDILSLPSRAAAIMSIVGMVAICRQEISNALFLRVERTCRGGILNIATLRDISNDLNDPNHPHQPVNKGLR